MNAPQKIAVFTLGLTIVFAAAFGVGATWGPDGAAVAPEHSQSHAGGPAAGGEASLTADDLPGGLSSSDHGYSLQLIQPLLHAGKQVPLRFRIADGSGAPVTDYIDSHEKQLHLIVVRRDLVGFQHVHPTLDGSGTWSVPVNLEAGDYRVFADFVPAGGDAMTLGADVHVAGLYDPQPLPALARTTSVDGYTVTLSGSPEAAESSPLTLSVSRDGEPVTDLQPYLGAYGHLVVLRASDLAYLHVHPIGEPGDGVTPAGPEIGFRTTIPSSGDYRLFLDFKHRDVVHTAEFTVSAGAGHQQAAPPPPPGQPAPAGDGHGH